MATGKTTPYPPPYPRACGCSGRAWVGEKGTARTEMEASWTSPPSSSEDNPETREPEEGKRIPYLTLLSISKGLLMQPN